ncbi:MAG: hypothetical protein MUP14_05435 [Dehalococcoidia bacterium]|nr:hypothetical protein [Dehalococcoidia bacterium]
MTAGDVAAAHVGRGFNTLFGQWMTVSGTNLGDSRMTGSVLLAANIGIHTSGGMMRDGVVITAYVLNDPLHPEMAAEWFRGLHSKGFRPHWEGRRDMCAGFFWRIEKGGLVATDVVDMLVRYE